MPSSPSGLLSREALFPSLVLVPLTATYGAIVTFLPLLAEAKDIAPSGVGLFFAVYAVVLLLARAVGGTLSDRFGRAAVVMPGLLLAAVGMAVLSQASSLPMLLGVAVIYGMGFAAVHPALMALTTDRTQEGRRGAAMATFSAAFDLGIGAGALLWGITLELVGFSAMYLSASAVALLGLAGFLAGWRARI